MISVMGKPDMILLSPCSPDECARRLREAVTYSGTSLFDPRPGLRGTRVRARVKPEGFVVHIDGLGGNATYVPYCYGRFIPDPRGTVIEARMRYAWSARIFAMLVAVFIALFGLGWLGIGLFGSGFERDIRAFVISVGVASLAAVVWIVIWANRRAGSSRRSEWVCISDFLEQAFEAQPDRPGDTR
jgi:hypothetical protein